MSPRAHRPNRVTAAALLWVLSVLVFACAAPLLLLGAAPLLGLVALLLVGRFPGEDLLAEIRARRATVPARQSRREPAAVRRVVLFVRPVGRAATFALAMRPPPALCV